MILSGNQPYLFPYFAYWQLINSADIFVIGDNLQYSKNGYIKKNYILFQGKKHKFSLEVVGVHLGMSINEVAIGENGKSLLGLFQNAYKKAPYYLEIYPMLEDILLNDEKNLGKYLNYSIKKIASYLDMDTKITNWETISSYKSAQDAVIDLCKSHNADRYINAIGGEVLYNQDDFLKEGIKLNFLQMDEIKYKQFDHEFIPNLSIIDVMMFNSKDEIKKMLEMYRLI